MRNLNIVFKYTFFLLFGASHIFATGKVAVVLSGGGAQAMAHIGVLKAFEEERIPIDYLIGSSGGSIIGGLYAAGVSLDELEIMARDGTIMKLFLGRQERSDSPVYLRELKRNGHFSIGNYEGDIKASPGLLNDNLIRKELFLLTAPAEYRAHQNFDSLLIPFRAIGADMVNKKAVAIHSGSLAEALRISMSMPLIYPPVLKGNRMFLDGGIYAKVPTFAAHELEADVVIAVNAGDPTPPVNEVRDVFDFFDSMNALLFSYSDSNHVKGWDYYINIDTEGFNVFDFAGGERLIARGYAAGKKAVNKISRELNQKRDMVIFRKRQHLFRTALDGIRIDSIGWIDKQSGSVTVPRYKINLPFYYSTSALNDLINALYATNVYESIVPLLSNKEGQLDFIFQNKARWSVTPEIKISSVDGFYLETAIEHHVKNYRYWNPIQVGIGNRKADYRYAFSPVHFWYMEKGVKPNYFLEFTHSSVYHSYRMQDSPENNIKYYSSELNLLNHLVLSWNQELLAGVGIRYGYWRNINKVISVLNHTVSTRSFYPYAKLSYHYNRLSREIPFTQGRKIILQALAGNENKKLFYRISLETKTGFQLNKTYHFGLDIALQSSSDQTPLELLPETQIPVAYTESHYFHKLAYSTVTLAPAFSGSFFRNDLFFTIKSMHAYLQKRISGRADGWSWGWDTYLTYNSILGQLQLGWSFWADDNYQAVSWTKVHIYL